MKTKKQDIYIRYLRSATFAWIVCALAQGIPGISNYDIFVMVTCIYGLLIAPALAGVVLLLCLVGAMWRPKFSPLLLNVGEFAGQFALIIDKVLAVIPGNPFAFGLQLHMNYLAIVLSTKQNYKEALELLQDLIKLVEKEEGKQSVALVEPLSILNSALRGLGKYDESATCANRLLAIAEQHKGECLSTVGATLADLCVTYSKQGRIKESEEIGEKAIKLLQQVPDEELMDGKLAIIAIAMNNLGAVYSLGCKYERAYELYKRSLELKKKVMQEGDTSIGESYGNVACALLIQEKYEEAIDYAEKANAIFEAVGPKSSWAIVQQVMGDAYRGLGQLDVAETKLSEALKVQEKLFAKGDPTLADTYRDMGKLYRDKGDYAKGERYFSKAMSLFESSVGANHPQISRTLKEYCQLLKACGRDAEVAAAQERIDKINDYQEAQDGATKSCANASAAALENVQQRNEGDCAGD